MLILVDRQFCGGHHSLSWGQLSIRGAMEKETKEWGNKEQRTMLHILRVMFPEVDIRIIKATVLEGNDIDAAVEFILTEVLEQPSTAKELISGFLKTAGDSSDGEMTLSAFFRKASDGNQLVQPKSEVEVKDVSANMDATMAESLYTSVVDADIETDHPGTDAGTRKLGDPWCEDEKRLEKHTSSQGRGCDYDSDDDYSDLPEFKSLLIPVPTEQFDGMSRYSCEGSSLVASSVLEETYDGLFNSSSYSVMDGSSQQLGIDALDELVNSAKSDKEALVTAIEAMRAMRSAVEQAEAAAQQAKRDAMNAGLDVLAEVEEMQDMLDQARGANERNFLEVYGEKAVLRTESQGLQRRLQQLKAEKDRALAAVQEMRATLQARIDRANDEREAAEEEMRLEEERARAMLAVEAELTAKVAEESRRLDAEEEACTKLRDFLIDRGSIVDSLQGEVAIICEDVEAVKKQLDEGILFGESGFLNMLGSRSLSNSGSVKAGDAGDSHFGALNHSGSSYRSVTKGGEGDVNIMDLSTSDVVDQASRVTPTHAEEYCRTGPTESDTDLGGDDCWNFVVTSSGNSNETSDSFPSYVKRSTSNAVTA